MVVKDRHFNVFNLEFSEFGLFLSAPLLLYLSISLIYFDILFQSHENYF